MVATYAVAIFAYLLSGASALTLFAWVGRLDPPEIKPAAKRDTIVVAA